MTRRLINTCALLTLGLLLIIWLRSRLVVLAPRRVWSPSPPDVVFGPLPVEVEWRVAVGCGFSGFFVEVALGFMLPLASSGSFRLLCGKCDEAFLTGQLTVKEADAIRRTWADESARTAAQTRAAIVIEHGEPCSIRRWPASDRPLWVISRTMTEGDLAPEQAECLRNADEVWVPTWWHVERFVAAGVPRPQLRVVPEPVELETFAPHAASASAAAVPSRPFVFLSNFKWEQRKGWDLLLRAYWAEFKSETNGCAALCPPKRGALLTLLAPPHPPRPTTRPHAPHHHLEQARAAPHQDVPALVGGRAERSQRVARHLCRRAGAAPPPRRPRTPAPPPRRPRAAPVPLHRPRAAREF